jgi:hypothetical protein
MREAETVTFSVALSCACAAPIIPGANAAINAAVLAIDKARRFRAQRAGGQATAFIAVEIMGSPLCSLMRTLFLFFVVLDNIQYSEPFITY